MLLLDVFAKPSAAECSFFIFINFVVKTFCLMVIEVNTNSAITTHMQMPCWMVSLKIMFL